MAMPMKKHPRPHHKSFAPAKTKGKQTRKSGKGTSLMHAAAKAQSRKSVADANQGPAGSTSKEPSPNRADYELARLQKGNDA